MIRSARYQALLRRTAPVLGHSSRALRRLSHARWCTPDLAFPGIADYRAKAVASFWTVGMLTSLKALVEDFGVAATAAGVEGWPLRSARYQALLPRTAPVPGRGVQRA